MNMRMIAVPSSTIGLLWMIVFMLFLGMSSGLSYGYVPFRISCFSRPHCFPRSRAHQKACGPSFHYARGLGPTKARTSTAMLPGCIMSWTAVHAAAGNPSIGVIGFLGASVGFVLGLLGGGGSILALPIFLEVFHEQPSTAIAESLLVVAVGAGAGLLAKLEAVDVKQIAPLCGFAMLGSAATARLAPGIPAIVRLGLFSVFALYSAASMLQAAAGAEEGAAGVPVTDEKAQVAETNGGEHAAAWRAGSAAPFILWAQLFAVGSLTSIIGAGGGFVIVPLLTRFASMELKPAVASSLLIICLNSLVGFGSFWGVVPIQLPLVLPFAGAAAVGALLGNAASKMVSQKTVKILFASTILVCGTGLVAVKLPALLDASF